MLMRLVPLVRIISVLCWSLTFDVLGRTIVRQGVHSELDELKAFYDGLADFFTDIG